MLPKSVDNLKKEGTKEDKVAVASGIAVSVVVILLVAWAIFFLRGLSRGSQDMQLGGIQDQFNFKSVQDAQQALENDLSNPSSDLQNVGKESAGEGSVQMQISGQQVDQFGTSGGGY